MVVSRFLFPFISHLEWRTRDRLSACPLPPVGGVLTLFIYTRPRRKRMKILLLLNENGWRKQTPTGEAKRDHAGTAAYLFGHHHNICPCPKSNLDQVKSVDRTISPTNKKEQGTLFFCALCPSSPPCLIFDHDDDVKNRRVHYFVNAEKLRNSSSRCC